MTCRNFLRLMAAVAAVVRVAPLAAQASTVILVRHAEKASSTRDAELSEAGRARAQALSAVLANYPLSAVIVSEYRRTQETAGPAATSNHLVPTVVPVSGDPTISATSVALVLRQLPAGSAALVVGHSNTLAPIIAALGGPRLPDLCDTEYATIYVLELSGAGPTPRLLRASYGLADPPEAGCCDHDR
ncbi:MAG: histidine phosphatase family protein [Gemmatimonadales bacterium]